KGVCAYFGQTPTWDFYSDELVSHDIPTQMNTGEVRTVHITFRNRGVLWTEAKAIRLGAVGDSDPFTTQTRHTISGEVGPNQTYTWTFNLTAPTTPGQYVTDWRMVRDGVTWFGATCSQTINVVASDSQAPSVPTNLSATVKSPSRIDLAWNASTDNIGVTGYKIYRNGGQIGTSASTSYVDSSCSANASYTYTVAAYDAAGNTSGQSSPAFATTPPSEIVIDNPSCELSGVWSTGTSATDKYGADYYFASSAVSEGKTATWRPNFAFGGSYDVYAWWPAGTNRAPNAPYTVAWSGGSQVVQMNQQSNGGQWNSLVSSKTFAMGTGGYVRLSNGTGQTGYVVMADAVRWVTLSVDTVAPSVPTNVAANPVSCTQINLTWNASTDNVAIGGYKIYRNGVQVGTSAATSYSDTDCSPGTTYTYRVSAYDTAGNESAQSSQVAATTPGDTTAPSVPTNLSANAVSGTQVDLTWTASTDNIGVAGYKIYRNGSQIGTSSSTSYSDTTCSPGQSYTYEVSAYDAASNESAKSTPAVVTTPGVDTIAPSVPTNLSATAVSGTQVDLSWTASTDNVGVVGYKVYRNGVQVGTSVGTSYSDTGCVPATSYTYEVSAYDAASNESAKSTPATVVTPDTIAPSVPTNLSATAVSGTQVDLSWTASTDNVGVVGYKVYRNGVQVGTSTGTSYSDTGCVPATSYTYEVSAYDAASNESAKSTPATVVTPDTIAPSVPTNLSATAVSGTQVNLSWTASTDNVGVVGYKVYRNGVQVGTSTGTSYSDTGCVPATSYTYEVSAYDAASNESAKSAPATVVTPDTIAPSVPTNLQASAVSQTQINLSWTASTDNVGVVGYKIYRNGAQIATSTTTSYSDTTCESYTTYTYRVSAYDGSNNESGLSNQATATTLPYTDIILDNNVAVYVGTWFTGTSATDKYGSDYRYGTTDTVESRTATWTPDIDISGYYTVYAWWPQGSNRSSAAPYTIYWDGGSQTVAVNQKTNGGMWNTLVTNKRFLAGTGQSVKLSNNTGEASLNVMADAVRFLLVSDDLTPPSVPSNVSAVGVSASQVNVSWTASTDNVGVSGYKVYRNGVQVATTASTSYSDTGLSELTTYTYEVSAYDAMGNESAKSAQATGTTLDGTPPSVPSGVTATAVGPQRINLTWTASTDNVGVAGYKVYRNGSYIGYTASTSYSDGGLSPSTSYTYTISAYDAASNESSQSSGASATTPGYANVIVDNPACTFTGVWTIATASTDKYGSDYAYASTAVSEGKTAKWIPSIPYSGNYDTYIWYPQGSNRATNAPFTLYWDGGSQTVAWNQQTNGGAWRLLLGNKHFVAGTSCYLKLGNGTGATGFIVVADGARFQQISGD
ncbi:MAG: hypothetical protein QHH26_08695, partial [Armatimonadota bacterium]|nr:hypothetical protein [Armatimonadota bacterium]